MVFNFAFEDGKTQKFSGIFTKLVQNGGSIGESTIIFEVDFKIV